MAAAWIALAGAAHAITAPPGFVVENPFPGVTFTTPMQIVFLPDGRKLVVEKAGTIRVMTAAGVKLTTPFVNLSARVNSGGDRGLMSMALDPDYPSNGWVYLLYTVDPDSNNNENEVGLYARVERYKASASDPNVLDLTSRQVLIGTGYADGIPFPGPGKSHVVGTLRFGRDKTLLVGCGDGANFTNADKGGQNPSAFGPGLISPTEDIGAYRSQNINSMAGKILRIDKETGWGLPSNPFWNGSPTAARSRVWLYGVRNPFRYSVRPGTGSDNSADGAPGTLYVADVGWFTWEELNVVSHSGLNLGWPCVEGPEAAGLYADGPQPAGYGCGNYGSAVNPNTPTGPQAYWNHYDSAESSPPGATGAAFVAGAYYTGANYPVGYRNSLFVADYIGGWVGVVQLDANDHVLGYTPFITSGADTPVDLEIEPETGDVWYVSIATGNVRRIRFATGNRDPLASATVSPNYGFAPLLTTFDASATVDADADPLAFQWDFGDGVTDTARVTSHLYTVDGTYDVSLSVRDGHGGRDSLSYVVVVGASPPPGKIVLPPDGAFHVVGDLVQLQAVPVDSAVGPVTYRWDVDLLHFAHTHHVHQSQYTLYGETAQFLFDLAGNIEPTAYQVRLTVTSGALSTADTVIIHPRQDIVAGPIRIAPHSPRTGSTALVTTSLRAVGGIGEFETAWRLQDGTTTLATGIQPPLAAGDSAVVTIPVAWLSGGTRELSFIADSDEQRSETDESNNVTSLVVRVRDAGDAFATWCADSAAGAAPLPPTATGPWREPVSTLDGVLAGYPEGEARWHGAAVAGDPSYLSLDGTAEYVRLAAPGAAEELQGAPRSASVEMWFRPGGDVSRAQQLLHWADGASEPRSGLSLELSGGRLRVDARPLRDAGVATPHAWTHVLVSAGPESLRVYVNGHRTLTDNYSNMGAQWTELRLGAANAPGSGAPADFFAGDVGEVRLYEDALSDAQAVARYADRAPYYLGAAPVRARLLALAADSAIAGAPPASPGAASPWEDVSGHARDMTLSAFSSSSDTSGWQGDGTIASPWRLEFDGVDDVATLAPDTLPELSAAEPTTVAMWIRTGHDVQRAQTLLDWRESAASGAPAFVLSIASGSFRFGEGGGQAIATAAPDRWYHLVVSTAPDAALAWLDGAPVWTINAATGAAQHTLLALGGSAVGAGERFRGAVSRLEIWRGLFSDSEVDSLHQAQAGPYVHRLLVGQPGPLYLSLDHPCVNVPFHLLHTPSATLRGFSVTVRLGPGLALCGPAQVGPAFNGATPLLLELDPEPGLHMVDLVTLGAECAAGDTALFSLPLSATTTTGTSSLEIVSVTLRGCANEVLSVDLGDPLEVRIDKVAPAAPSAVATTPDPVHTGADGRYPLRIGFAVAADVESVQVYRAPFGNAPEYDDAPGSGQAPSPPASYPPPPPWQLTSVTHPGRTDEPAARDAWSYVAYAFDAAGNRSPVAPVSNELVNYRLGDVRGASASCSNDGVVGAGDLAGLAGSYGATLAASDARSCLDIGPTVDSSLTTRPRTDDVLDFEDLMMLALDHDATASGPAPGAGTDGLALAAGSGPAVGDTINVQVFIAGYGRTHGLSIKLLFDAARVTPVEVRPGWMLASQALPSVVLSPGGAVADIALLGKGPGLVGTGQVAIIRFRRLSPGTVSVALGDVKGRDAQNHAVSLALNFPLADAAPIQVDHVALSPGVPDPFRESVDFQLSLPRAGQVRLTAFDLAGRRVRTLWDGPRDAGVHHIRWDGRDESGQRIAPGIYWLALEADRVRSTRRVVRLR